MELQLSANLAKLIDRLTRLLVVTTRRSRCVSSRFCSSRSSSAASVELASDVPDPHDSGCPSISLPRERHSGP